MKVILDSGPTGLITNPNSSNEAAACKHWLKSMLLIGHEVVLPEIIDYEIRRELLRARKLTGLIRLMSCTTKSLFFRSTGRQS